MERNYDVITFSLKYVYFKKAFFFVTLFRVEFFKPQLTLRQLIYSDVESWLIVRFQLGPSIQPGSSPSSQCWIRGGHTIHQPIEGMLPPTGNKPTSFRNSASKGSWITEACHYTRPILLKLQSNLSKKFFKTQKNQISCIKMQFLFVFPYKKTLMLAKLKECVYIFFQILFRKCINAPTFTIMGIF